MNIIKLELKLTRKPFVILTISLCVITSLMSLFFGGFSESMDAIETLINSYPKGLLKGFRIDMSIFSSFIAYLSYIIVYVLIALSIYMLQLGMSITSREKTIGMSDFLIVKPVSRVKIFVLKSLAYTFRLLTLVLFIFLTSLFMNYVYDDIDLYKISLIFISFCLIGIYFLALGAFISSFMKQNKLIIPLSIGVVLIMFFITMFQRIFSDNTLKYLTPFSHFDIADISVKGHFDSKMFIFNIACSMILFTIAIINYKKQDFRK